MKKLCLALMPVVMLSMLVLVGCGKSPSTATSTGNNNGGGCTATQTIEMGATAFSSPADGGCAQVSKGQAVTFKSEGVHILCTGPSNGTYAATCTPDSNAPSQFGAGSGDQFQDGTSQQITFDNPGTYNIVCIVHPNMRITVKVV